MGDTHFVFDVFLERRNLFLGLLETLLELCVWMCVTMCVRVRVRVCVCV